MKPHHLCAAASLVLLFSCNFSDSELVQSKYPFMDNSELSIDSLTQEKTDESLADTLETEIDDYLPSPPKFDTHFYAIKFKTSTSYTSTKAKSIQLRNQLNKEYISKAPISVAIQDSILSTIQAQFTDFLLNAIIPHWYGTPWDFNGHTSIPNQGEIACGYFVSTTLRDIGLKLNRFKMGPTICCKYFKNNLQREFDYQLYSFKR